MSGKLNWSKVEQERKMRHFPSPRSEAPTQRQINYIAFLARKKGQTIPKTPRTKYSAGRIIDDLVAMPDVEAEIQPIRPVSENNPVTEMVAELRESFPQLTPMAANSLINLFAIIDPIGVAFTLDVLMREDAPEDRDELIVYLLRRFLEEFSTNG